jgi:hypothetical protein
LIRPGVPLLAGALVLAPAAGALAHSLLLEAAPAAGAVVAAAPAEIALRFNNRVERRLSRVRLVDARGAAWPLALAARGSPGRLTATVPAGLAPGTYTVEWQVLSTDGHVVSGRYEFRLAP